MILLNMMSDFKIKQKFTAGSDKIYDGFSRLLLEMANEKVYDRRAAKGRGAALAAEKFARQAEYESADKRDYSEDREYSEAEWVDYEHGMNQKMAEVQEEFNCLGACKGGKGVKGCKCKGKAKGKGVGKG